MKFLEVPALSHLSGCLGEIDIGDSIVTGRLEAYSCKTAGADKKLYKSLNKYYETLALSPDTQQEMSRSPFGPFSLSTSRRTFISLICTLNASCPDYVFSSAKPDQFKREANLHMVINYINTILCPVLPDPHFTARLWQTLDEEIKLRECDVYSYLDDDDAFGGNIWAMNYFFFNKRQRCVVFLTCRCVSKSAYQLEASMHTGSESEEEEVGSGWPWSVEDQIAAEMEMDY